MLMWCLHSPHLLCKCPNVQHIHHSIRADYGLQKDRDSRTELKTQRNARAFHSSLCLFLPWQFWPFSHVSKSPVCVKTTFFMLPSYFHLLGTMLISCFSLQDLITQVSHIRIIKVSLNLIVEGFVSMKQGCKQTLHNYSSFTGCQNTTLTNTIS